MRVATVRYTDTGCEISSFFNEEFLRDLKAEIPHFARAWNNSRKVWIVEESYVTVAVEIARRYFRVVEHRHEERAREQHSSTCSGAHYDPNGAHSVLHLLSTAPPELVRAAYKCLALLHHPDHGGDVAKMQTINAAYEKLTK
jgi:hypothetical protein